MVKKSGDYRESQTQHSEDSEFRPGEFSHLEEPEYRPEEANRGLSRMEELFPDFKALMTKLRDNAKKAMKGMKFIFFLLLVTVVTAKR